MGSCWHQKTRDWKPAEVPPRRCCRALTGEAWGALGIPPPDRWIFTLPPHKGGFRSEHIKMSPLWRSQVFEQSLCTQEVRVPKCYMGFPPPR